MKPLVISSTAGACALCGEIGDDVAGDPMCFGNCGNPDLIPHLGTHCERCGGKLVSGQFL